AEIAERPRTPKHRVQALSDDLGLAVRVVDEIPPEQRKRAQVYERHGRSVLVLPGPRAPFAVSLERPSSEPRWLVVTFQADLYRPRTRVGLGLLLLTAAAMFLAFLMLRFVFRPLEVATTAMQRVAAGDLNHRVPNRGAVTEVADTFNTMADRVQHLVQGQRDLMAAVSHELRTPLTRMRLLLELLPDSNDPISRIQALTKDVNEVDALVSELLESAHLHRGTLALTYEEVAAGDLLQRALAQVDLGTRTVQVEDTTKQNFFGDKRRLLRCLTNLLSNVARYTPNHCEVRIYASEDDSHTWLSVGDSGPGVATADRTRLFEPFFRAEGSRSRATGGLGLGLMLVKQIIDAHAGTIEALESPQGGLLVRMGIPIGGPGD
ncbi:MAG TPA: hypothetical protein DFR83_15635, partial [Deltaproteobacteria bacterium]|nr:hypothetical protein [Deltaproteobacteria bacterium]